MPKKDAETVDGAPCKLGHTLYFKSTMRCVECYRSAEKRYKDQRSRSNPRPISDLTRAKKRQYRRNNIESYRAREAAYRNANAKAIAAVAAAYRLKNLDACRTRQTIWRAENPDTVRQYDRQRRALKCSAPGQHTASLVQAILEAQGNRCAYCNESDGLHLDHVIPLSRGGSDYPWNLQWLCAFHNLSKGARTDAEYRALIGLPACVPISMQLWTAIFAT